MEFAKKGCFNLSTAVVIGVEALEDFIHALEEKGPKAMKRTVIFDE